MKMSFKKVPTKNELLQIAYPNLYEKLIEFLLIFNIHSYDVRATCRSIDDKIEIKIKFGDGFANKRMELFSKDELGRSGRFESFCEEIAETCKETLIADYFKMVNP